MAVYKEMTVVDSSITPGLLDLDSDMLNGTEAAANGFSFANDGRTILIVKDTAAAAGDEILFVGRADEYGRQETTANLTKTIGDELICIFGPFPQHLWNQTGGFVAFDFTGASAATTFVVAVRV